MFLKEENDPENDAPDSPPARPSIAKTPLREPSSVAELLPAAGRPSLRPSRKKTQGLRAGRPCGACAAPGLASARRGCGRLCVFSAPGYAVGRCAGSPRRGPPGCLSALRGLVGFAVFALALRCWWRGRPPRPFCRRCPLAPPFSAACRAALCLPLRRPRLRPRAVVPAWVRLPPPPPSVVLPPGRGCLVVLVAFGCLLLLCVWGAVLLP